MPSTAQYLNAAARTSANNDLVQIVTPSGSRVNLTAPVASSAEAALPAKSGVLRIGATEACWIRFGNTGMGAAAADANSMYFPSGVEYLGIPLDSSGVPYDYVRAIRAGANDSVLQFERVA